MNALMLIQIRVQEQQARRAIQNLNGDIARLTASARAASAATGSIVTGSTLASIGKWGSQLQWAGRQLTYNFSLPLALAGGMAAKWALENEKAMVRVVKVYGDLSMSQAQVKSETDALAKSFEALSNTFGVAQADVINIAADWAAAGASGVALAKSVKLTLETMILGELDAADSTRALIAIQAQYGESVKELSKTIDILNMVENQTGTTMGDLIMSMSRSAGAARTAGVDVQHLAAFTAALVPAAGSAAQAGNALKTIFSRILAPTKEAAGLMKEMGLNTQSAAWQNKTATERMEDMAHAFDQLSDSQKAQVSASVASRYQINKFDVLMRDIISTNGYYQKALKASADETANFKQKQYELQQVLSSNPQRLKQMWVILQNAMADIIQPMIPVIVFLAQEIAKLATWFSNLNPVVQKAILALAAGLVVIGPLARLIGSFGVLIEVLGKAFLFLRANMLVPIKWLLMLVRIPFSAIATGIGAVVGMFISLGTALVGAVTGFATFVGGVIAGTTTITVTLATLPEILAAIGGGILAALTSPWTLAAAAIIGIVAFFWKDIQTLWKSVVEGMGRNADGIAKGFAPLVKFFWTAVDSIKEAFYSLPKGVQSAMIAVVKVVQAAAMAVYNLFSYINPFAHHSPSLVETVTWGMAEIKKQFASVGNVGGIFKKAATDLKAFKTIAASMNFDEWSDKRADVKKAMPQNLPNFNKLVGDLKVLNQLLVAQKNAVNAQSLVVDKWKASLDRANDALDKQQAKLQAAEDKLNKLKDAYQAHEDAISRYASTGIKGMQAMDDQIFANTQAQKALQLQIMQLEDAGMSVEDLSNKMAALQGDIEGVQGVMADLQQNGAGSDVTGPLADQVKAMQDQYKKMGDQVKNNPINDLQKQLEELQRKGTELDLQNSLQFDGLTRQIEQAANATKELTFQQIIDGINKEKQAMAELAPQIDAAQTAYDKQKKTVDAATKSRDAVQASYDKEYKKLQGLQDQYQKTADAIRDIESALNDVSSAAAKMNDALSKSGGGKGGAGGGGIPEGNWDDVGGNAKIGREGGAGDQSAQIDAFTKGLTDDLAKQLGKFDILGPIKKWWAKIQAWWSANVTPAWSSLTAAASDIWDGLDWSGFQSTISDLLGWFTDLWDGITEGASAIWDLIGPQFTNIFKNAGDGIRDALGKISDKVGPLWDALSGFFGDVGVWFSGWLKIAKPVLTFFTAVFLQGISQVFRMIGNIIQPVFAWIGDIIGAIIQILTGAVKVIGGIFRTIGGIFELVYDIFTGKWDKIGDAWDKIWDGLGEVVSGLWDIIKGAWDAIWKTVKGAIKVVVGLVAGFAQGVVDWFVWLNKRTGDKVGKLITGIIDWFKKLPGRIVSALSTFGQKLWDIATKAMGKLWDGLKSVWTTVATWFGTIGSLAITAIGDTLSTLYQVGVDFLTGMWDGIMWVWDHTIGAFWKGVAELVILLIGPVTKKLVQQGKDFMNGLWDGIKIIWASVKTWFSTLWKKITDAIGGVTTRLSGKGKDFLGGLAQGITDRWVTIKTWFSTLWKKITDAIGVVTGRLVTKGKDFLSGLSQGISDRWTTVKTWFSTLWSKITDAIGDVGSKLNSKGRSFISGLSEGITDRWATLKTWVGGLGDKVVSAVGNLGSKLYNAGWNIMKGFWDGIKDQWENVKDTVGGFGQWIADHKGPKSYDLKLLVPAGGWIMDGLNNGLLKSLPQLKGTLGTVSDAIAKGISAAPALSYKATQQATLGSAGLMGDKNSTLQAGNTTEVRIVNFYGPLEFPNVKSSDDAKGFLDNLDILAGGGQA